MFSTCNEEEPERWRLSLSHGVQTFWNDVAETPQLVYPILLRYASPPLCSSVSLAAPSLSIMKKRAGYEWFWNLRSALHTYIRRLSTDECRSDGLCGLLTSIKFYLTKLPFMFCCDACWTSLLDWYSNFETPADRTSKPGRMAWVGL